MAYAETTKITLPDFDLRKVFKIPSDESVGLKHLVSLKNMTCDCQDFATNHSQFEKNDFRRTCKHIRTAIVQSDLIVDSWLRKLIGDRFVHEHYYVPAGSDCAFGYSMENPWIQYYGKHYTTRNGAKVYYGRFSYSVTERRWSSNQLPMNASEIVTMIEKLFPVTESQKNWKSHSGDVTITIDVADLLKRSKK